MVGSAIIMFAIILIVLQFTGLLSLESFTLIVTIIGIVLPIYIFIYMITNKKTMKLNVSVFIVIFLYL